MTTLEQTDVERPLRGHVAVVTGGSSGLGRATAIALAGAGARVAVLGRTESHLRDTVAQFPDPSDGAAIAVDLADADAAVGALRRTRERLGAVDILVNAAGTDVPGSIVELDVAGWDRVLDVNLRAVFLLTREVFPDMSARGRGTIITIGSVAGRRGWANASAYCASKFALTGLTQTIAAEGREHGIRATLLYPGAMDTSWGSWNAEERTSSPEGSDTASSMPPEHVARLITWIAQSPPDMVLNEATVTPLLENGWP